MPNVKEIGVEAIMYNSRWWTNPRYVEMMKVAMTRQIAQRGNIVGEVTFILNDEHPATCQRLPFANHRHAYAMADVELNLA